jgi:hypothetical protein
MSNPLEIRRLNDSFRRSLSGGGKRLMTAGIAALPYPDQAVILRKVIAFDQFSEDITTPMANMISARLTMLASVSSGRSTITIYRKNSARKTRPTPPRQRASSRSGWRTSVDPPFPPGLPPGGN